MRCFSAKHKSVWISCVDSITHYLRYRIAVRWRVFQFEKLEQFRNAEMRIPIAIHPDAWRDPLGESIATGWRGWIHLVRVAPSLISSSV